MSILSRCRFLLFVFVVCSVNAQTTIKDRLDELLEIYNINNAPGLSVKVLKEGRSIYSKSYGFSNLDYDVKNSDSTVFSLASISKQFTASAIWALMNEGKIDLEDDVRKFLPEFPKYDKPIKIKHLLNHTSGIRNYHTLMDLSGFNYHTTYYDNSTVLQLACRQKGLNNLPGEKIKYSNTNYNLLALIVERISDQNLDAFLKEKILTPLEMKHTHVRASHGNTIKNKAIGYQKRNGKYIYNVTNQLSYGAGSMGSSINDMTIWMQMLNEQIPEFIDLAQFLKTREILTSGEQANYARGVSIDSYKGFEAVSHGGYGFGTRTQLVTIPELQTGIIVLANLQSINAPSIAYKILDVLMENLSKDQNRNVIHEAFKPQNFEKFIGEYKEINSDMTMTIFQENDTLKSIGSIGRVAAPLIQFANNKFHRVNSQNVKYEFETGKDYDMIIRFGGTPFYFKRAQFIDSKQVELSQYIGSFYSEELDINYHFSIDNNVLIVSFENRTFSLKPIQANEFGNGQRTLYHFIKGSNGNVTGMLLSCDGTVNNIIFNKKATIDQ
jgi:CubicO group peptidase (beta-lactamase class C family)